MKRQAFNISLILAILIPTYSRAEFANRCLKGSDSIQKTMYKMNFSKIYIDTTQKNSTNKQFKKAVPFSPQISLANDIYLKATEYDHGSITHPPYDVIISDEKTNCNVRIVIDYFGSSSQSIKLKKGLSTNIYDSSLHFVVDLPMIKFIDKKRAIEIKLFLNDINGVTCTTEAFQRLLSEKSPIRANFISDEKSKECVLENTDQEISNKEEKLGKQSAV